MSFDLVFGQTRRSWARNAAETLELTSPATIAPTAITPPTIAPLRKNRLRKRTKISREMYDEINSLAARGDRKARRTLSLLQQANAVPT
jgi:hypothetical protein